MDLNRHQFLSTVSALWVLIAGVLMAASPANSADERDVSAALTIRIAKFVGWPERATLADDQPFFIIGVMGGSGIRSAFSRFSGRFVNGKQVKVVKITPSTDSHSLRRCHIVYAESRKDVDLIAEMVARSEGVLTVAGPGGSGGGAACLDIVQEAGKLAFDINLRRTRNASLGVDAGLIQLAHKVSR
ncbi:MAG: YfiR family protein [Verrucomicrobiales bacterium]|nr:YfiR family protein [Verrucomicrobiales bacterium]